MKLLLANGNTTGAVTEAVRLAAIHSARPGTEITVVTAGFGVPIVSTELENTIAAHAVLDLLATHHAGHDAAILAISFDTALTAARQLLPIPVIGMTEASLHTACLLGRRFGVITFGSASLPMYLDLIDGLGLSSRLAGYESVDVTSVDAYLEAAAFDQIVRDAAIRLAAMADVVVVCGAAVSGIAARLQPTVAFPLLDGIGCAVRQAELLVDLATVKKPLGRPIAAGARAAGLSDALATLLQQATGAPDLPGRRRGGLVK